MRVGDYCKRRVITVDSTADIVEVAKTMRDAHVGFLIVTEEGDPKRVPLGVITDRDIVLQVCAREVDPHSVTAADVMSRHPLVAREEDDLQDALQGMRLAGFRRVPVITHDGALCGVIAIDDSIEIITSLLSDISGSIRNEQQEEYRRLA
jgi:CBS domain-containing protein